MLFPLWWQDSVPELLYGQHLEGSPLLFTLSRNPGTLREVTEQQIMLTVCLTNGPSWKQPGDHLWGSNVVMMAGIPARKIQPAWKFQAQGCTTPSLHLTVCQHNTCTEGWMECCESACICEQIKVARLRIIRTLACILWGPSLFLSCFQLTAANAQSTFWYSLESDASSADNQRDVLKMVNFLLPFVLLFLATFSHHMLFKISLAQNVTSKENIDKVAWLLLYVPFVCFSSSECHMYSYSERLVSSWVDFQEAFKFSIFKKKLFRKPSMI